MQVETMTVAGALVPLTPTLPAEPAEALAWEPAIAAYLAAALDSEHTRRAYGRHLCAAAAGFTDAGVGHVSDLTGAHLAAYRQWATHPERSLSPSSQAQALAAMRLFLKWLAPLGGHRLPAEV